MVPDAVFLQRIAADICAVEQGSRPGVTEHELRQISPQLRNLVVYNELHRAWHMLGKKGSIMIPSTKFNNAADPGHFAVASTAIDTKPNVPHFSMQPVSIVAVDKMGNETECVVNPTAGAWVQGTDQDELYEPFLWKEADLTLSEFGQGCIIYYIDSKINRETVIKWVTNTQGGAHYTNSKKREQRLRCT